MEKFMYIFHGGSDVAPSMRSPEAMQQHMQKWFAWIEKLKKSDRYESGEPLEPRGKLISGPKRVITDGPFAEGKELVGGFFIIKAKDLDEAVQLAKDYPDYDLGGKIEIRPVQKIEMM